MYYGPIPEYIGIWEGDMDAFYNEYRRLYPNDKIQIFGSIGKRTMDSSFRYGIEKYMSNDPIFKSIKRNDKIDDILL